MAITIIIGYRRPLALTVRITDIRTPVIVPEAVRRAIVPVRELKGPTAPIVPAVPIVLERAEWATVRHRVSVPVVSVPAIARQR